MSIVVPAVLPISKDDLEEKLALLASIPAVSRIQIDVVDGLFASPASWPYSPSTKSDLVLGKSQELQNMTQRGETLPHLDRIEYEIDLMCFDALRAAGEWLALGVSRLTFHAGSTDDLPRFLALARKRYGDIVSFGLALSSEGDLALVERVVSGIEYVQFMGIARLGRQGQPFDERALERARIFRERHPYIPVQIDGGVSRANARKLFAFGAANLVVGSAILRSRDPATALAELEALHNRLEA